MTKQVRELVDSLYRSASRQILATLIRLLGDFDVAEEALHDAFAVAVEQWSRHGVPANPRAWLISTGRFKAIDSMRRRARFGASLTALAKQLASSTSDAEAWDDESVEDDQLRLIFTCCHPALPPDAQVAMTLREVCGLTTDEIARAFLTRPPFSGLAPTTHNALKSASAISSKCIPGCGAGLYPGSNSGVSPISRAPRELA